MKYIKLYNNEPNLTLLLPVNCQANCDFCFWSKHQRVSFEDYMKELKNTLINLPKEFRQVSISGGEPTMLKINQFKELLELLTMRFDKIVLNTNGYKLLHFLHDDFIKNSLTHINLSRHSVLSSENKRIFKTENIPSKYDITLINRIKKVRINCVYSDKESLNVIEWVNFIKETESDGVAFRRLAEEGVNNESQVEMRNFHNKILNLEYKNKCLVCYGAHYTFLGDKNTNIYFRRSVNEPIDFMPKNTIFEIIIHENGKPYTSWNKGNVIDLSTIIYKETINLKLVKLLLKGLYKLREVKNHVKYNNF